MSNDKNPGLKCRSLLGGAGLGLAAAVAGPTFARGGAMSGQDKTGSESAAAPMVDPDDKYPQPPFEAQQQPWPGLASRMNPRPDHGETS